MACFIVPATEAVVTTIAAKLMEKKENEKMAEDLKQGITVAELHKETLSSKLKKLNGLLWGGSVLLAFEHAWHGELQPFFPFLTAASNAADFTEMLHEMSTVGVGMAVMVTAVWGVITLASDVIVKRAGKSLPEAKMEQKRG